MSPPLPRWGWWMFPGLRNSGRLSVVITHKWGVKLGLGGQGLEAAL